ncbi:hypothetical protein OS493_035391 [Desmophyllum pertusum]|uniref:Uncharacterized protein n=1 Tax=Desmophyllum pertusum TaxID=174260 RepID=A0A9W9ZVW6_9CNID|nr:hypothetical protein OS493_035391 [Desmophyllum pertusum]
MAPVSSVFPVKYVVLFFLIAFSLFAVSHAEYCFKTSDCGSPRQLCCNSECVYRSSCLGLDCAFDSECSSGESCCVTKCTNGPNCVGFKCSTESDCDGTGTYQNKVVCCKGTCTKYDVCYPTPIIVGSVVGSLIFICIIAGIFFACRWRRRVHRAIESRIIAEQSVTETSTRCATQSNPLYQGKYPRSYQQGYPYHPPPQHEQQQTAIPPRYKPETMAATQQPPPDTAAQQGRSGGVYAPKPSYGAVPPD